MTNNIKASNAYDNITKTLKEIKMKNKKKRKMKEPEPTQLQLVNDVRLTSSTGWNIHKAVNNPTTVKTPTTIAMLIYTALEDLELARETTLCDATHLLKDLNAELDDLKIPVLVYHWFTKPTLKYVPVASLLRLESKPGREIEIFMTFPVDVRNPSASSQTFSLWRESDRVAYEELTKRLATMITGYCVRVHEWFEYSTHN